VAKRPGCRGLFCWLVGRCGSVITGRGHGHSRRESRSRLACKAPRCVSRGRQSWPRSPA